MHAFWVVLGIVVLVLGALDVFLTALNYDEAGFLATPLCTLQWRCLRSGTRRLSRRWRPVALRQVSGLQVMLSVVTWLGCVILGFGFIYYGLMYGTNFQFDGQHLAAGLFSAMYLSAAQLATVGTSQISPETDLLRTLSILETLGGLVLVTLILTFQFGVYQVVRDLRTLSSNFSTAEPGLGDPVDSLRTYFPQGQPTGLDSHLQAISASFWSYTDGLRLHHIAYYFQSGRDHFSLPYVMYMLGGSLTALRWGLPSGHPASVDPTLAPLIAQFEQFTDYLQGTLGWVSSGVPEVASFETFSAAYHGTVDAQDIWLDRFMRLNRDMARLARLDPATDPREAYERYRQWLPFAYRAEQVTAAVSRDLDYQPIIRGDERARLHVSQASGAPAAGSPFSIRTPARLWRALLNRWVAVPDPGLVRLMTAAEAVLAAAAAVASLYLLLTLAGVPALKPAIFGGAVGMWAAMMPGDATTGRRQVTTLLAVLPVVGAAALGAAVVPSFALSTAVLVIVVLLGVWVGGFGPRPAALGQMAFMSYYFALLMQFRLAQLPSFAVAAAVGVLWACLFRFALTAMQRPDQILRGGMAAFGARLSLTLEPLIDAVSAARWDPDIGKRVRTNIRQLHRCAAFLQGQLRAIDPASAGPQARPGELRLRLFDTELAATNTVEAARQAASAGMMIPVVLRAELAGMLDRAKDHLHRQGLRAASRASASAAPAHHGTPEDVRRRSEDWPEPARRLYSATEELLHAASIMHAVQTGDLADPRLAARETTPDTSLGPPESSPASQQEPPGAEPRDLGLRAPSTRRAIQAAVASGLALLAGGAVSSANQYWAVLAAFLVLGGTETVEETVVKGIQRLAGTIIGAVVGFGVTILTGADPFVILPLLAVSLFAAVYLRPISYALMVFWVTMLLALLYEFLGTLETEKLEVRVLETGIGAAIAFAAAALLLPVRTRQKMNGGAVALLQTLSGITQTCLQRLSGTSDVPSLGGQALTLDKQFQHLNRSAAPLRRASGALRRDGIERRLTAAAALTYYARHLIRATEALSPGTAPLPAPACAQLATQTRANIDTLVQVLTNEVPGPLHVSGQLPLPDMDEAQPEAGNAEYKAALHYLGRINQTVLTLIEDVTHDTATNASGPAPTDETEAAQDRSP